MEYRIDDVEIYNEYSEDPDVENSFRYAKEAMPVYARELPEGERVLSTTPEDGSEVFGHLHVYEDPETDIGRRFIVVKRQES